VLAEQKRENVVHPRAFWMTQIYYYLQPLSNFKLKKWCGLKFYAVKNSNLAVKPQSK
jgi:hypothetical protein